MDEGVERFRDITHRLHNHAPTGFVRTRMPGRIKADVLLDALTVQFVDIGMYLVDVLPEGQEKSLALTKLEEVSMWSKAAVARNQED